MRTFTTIGTLALLACRDPASPPVPGAAAVMLGEWTYATRPVSTSPSLNTGVHVTLAIDSADDAHFSGKVTSWFVGDVGVVPSEFSRLQGNIDAAGAVMVEFRRTKGETTITLQGVVAGDVLTVDECWLGDVPGPFAVGSWFNRVR